MAHDGRVREPRPSYNLTIFHNYMKAKSFSVVTWFSPTENQTKYVEKSKALEKDEHTQYLVCVRIGSRYFKTIKLPININSK